MLYRTPSNPTNINISPFGHRNTLSLTEAQRERTLKISNLQKLAAELHPMVNQTLQHNRQRARDAQSRGFLPKFVEGDYVLVARDEFFEGEKLCLRLCGPRRIVKVLNDYLFQVQDIRTGDSTNVHG